MHVQGIQLQLNWYVSSKEGPFLIRCLSTHHYLGVYKCFHTRDIDVDRLSSAENWDGVHIKPQLGACCFYPDMQGYWHARIQLFNEATSGSLSGKLPCERKTEKAPHTIRKTHDTKKDNVHYMYMKSDGNYLTTGKWTMQGIYCVLHIFDKCTMIELGTMLWLCMRKINL